MNQDGNTESRNERAAAVRLANLNAVYRDQAENRSSAAVHHRSAKATNGGGGKAGIGNCGEIDQILYQSEAGAHRKPGDCRIHHEAEAPSAYQPKNVQRLENFLQDGCTVGRPRIRGKAGDCERARVQSVAEQADQRTDAHSLKHPPQAQQLIGIDDLQPEQKDENGQQAQARLGQQDSNDGLRSRSKDLQRNHILPRQAAVIVGGLRIAAGESGIEVGEQNDAEIELGSEIGIVSTGGRISEIREQAG